MIRKLLPGLIPLLVFVIADEIWGMKIGLLVAVLIGIIELVITWIKERKLDHFVILDVFLLFIFSLLSYVFENEIFFKVKPAMLNLVLLSLISMSLFTRLDPLGAMTQRMMKGFTMNEDQQVQFRKSLWAMFWIVAIHTTLVLISAFFFSKEVWVFVSSFLLFILMGIYFGLQILLQKFRNRNFPKYSDAEEWLPVVDDQGKILGKALRSSCHNGSKILHPVIHLHVMGENKTLLLQKRSLTKLVQPGKWDTSVGGHVAFGENLEQTLLREAKEEIGLENFQAKPILVYRWDTEIESELVYSYVTYTNFPCKINSLEIEESKYWSIKDIKAHLNTGIFTPNFEHEFKLLNQHHLI